MKIQTLEADSIWLEYRGIKVLQSIYIKIQTGQVVGLLGRNGTGKSSLLRMIFGTLRGQSQSVRLNGEFLSHPYLKEGVICYLPQHNFVPSRLRVDKVCALYDVKFSEMCRYFPELRSLEKELTGNLSGGNLRLIETLLVLLSPVSFILLDEPFTHLSPVTIEVLKQVILEQKQHKGILISDHLYREILELSDAVYLIIPVGRSRLLNNPTEELAQYGYTT